MDEEALIARAKEEREKIFFRYDMGREPGAEIDPWEDPKFEVYHRTDRYGFIHDDRLSGKREPHEAKALEIEMERVKKWLKLLGLTSHQNKRSWNDKAVQAKVRKRVFKGIPEKVRGQVWCKLLNLEGVMKSKEGKYKKMLELARNWSTEARQIDKDVNRQFRDHIFYRERYSEMQKSLFNVLVAYSMYNTEVGYCQGMSGLAGVLLMYMKEEEAFWALSILFSDPKFAMHGLFIEGFPKLTRFLAHHDKIITRFIPKLKKHFDKANLDSILYSLKWFFVVFIERIPFSLCLRVWDIYLLDGEKVVTAMAFNILRMHKNEILKKQDMDQIVQYIQTDLCLNFRYTDDTVIKNLEQCMEELRKAGLELPPPPSEIELPKKEFGVFVEPTVAAQIGRRKEFTETEKDVTETVKLKREITEQEIANLNRIATTAGGSTQQMSTVHIPESEDGASLLGSSRKSLADTSVTSTADLSVLSGGHSQPSHQDQYFDDTRVVPREDDGDGEISPVSKRNLSTLRTASYGTRSGASNATAATSTSRTAKPSGQAASAIGSTSVVERSPSALQLMTPRAMSPQDVVRIYVPPAPPEESPHSNVVGSPKGASASGYDRPVPASTISETNGTRIYRNQTSRISYPDEDEDEESRTRRNSEIDLYLQQAIGAGSVGATGNGSVNTGPATMTSYGSGRFSDYTSGDFQRHGQPPAPIPAVAPISPSGPQNYASNGRSTSSSRRGSMSRKSPAPTLDSEFIIECSHVKNRKYVPDHHSSSNSLVLSVGGGLPTHGSRNGSETNIHRMTSFEELAKSKLQQHLSGTGSGGIMSSGSGSLVRNTQEDNYTVRQTVTVTNRMARSEIYETTERKEEETHYDSPRRRRPQDDSPSNRYEGSGNSLQTRKSSRGHRSDYNIQYRNLSPQGGGGLTSPQSDGAGEWSSGGGVEYRPFKASSRQNSGNDSSPFEYDPLSTGPDVPSKRYNRFFNNDEEGEEEDEDQRRELSNAAHSGRHREEEDKLLVKSSDDSSTSPPPPQASRPSQLPQYQRNGSTSGTGGRQRQRPRQRQPPQADPHNGTTRTPSIESLPLLPTSPVSTLSGSAKGTAGITSSIPVSSSKRKHSSDTLPPTAASVGRIPSTMNTPTGTRRHGSDVSGNVSPPSGLSRIPVGLKSPTSPTGSRIPTQRQFDDTRADGPAGFNSSERLPQYQYGTASGPSSLVHSPPSFQRAGDGTTQSTTGSGIYSSGSSRFGSSRSAHQIQSGTNKIRIQINPSQSYSSSSTTGG